MENNEQPNSWQREPDDDDLQQITPDMDEKERDHYLWKAIGHFYNLFPAYNVDTSFAKLVIWNLKNDPPFKKYDLRDANHFAWTKWTRK